MCIDTQQRGPVLRGSFRNSPLSSPVGRRAGHVEPRHEQAQRPPRRPGPRRHPGLRVPRSASPGAGRRAATRRLRRRRRRAQRLRNATSKHNPPRGPREEQSSRWRRRSSRPAPSSVRRLRSPGLGRRATPEKHGATRGLPLCSCRNRPSCQQGAQARKRLLPSRLDPAALRGPWPPESGARAGTTCARTARIRSGSARAWSAAEPARTPPRRPRSAQSRRRRPHPPRRDAGRPGRFD